MCSRFRLSSGARCRSDQHSIAPSRQLPLQPAPIRRLDFLMNQTVAPDRLLYGRRSWERLMQVTARDIEMLRWINGHGFATIRQMSRWMGTGYRTGQRRAQRLTEAGLLSHQWLMRRERIYWPTKLSINLCDDDLPPLGRIAAGTYHHTLQLIDLAHSLTTETGGSFVPERRLRHERGLTGVGLRGHLPDGHLQLRDRKPIAIELELSTKGRRRLAQIMRSYATDLSVGDVWYFAGSEALRLRLEKAARQRQLQNYRAALNFARCAPVLVGCLCKAPFSNRA